MECVVASSCHQFESAQSSQTLAEGLAEYFAANPLLKRESTLHSPQARQFFLAHDTVHVLYGCGTTMSDEAVVKLASLFGTTGGFQVLRGYVNHETLDIYTKLPLGSTLCGHRRGGYHRARGQHSGEIYKMSGLGHRAPQ